MLMLALSFVDVLALVCGFSTIFCHVIWVIRWLRGYFAGVINRGLDSHQVLVSPSSAVVRLAVSPHRRIRWGAGVSFLPSPSTQSRQINPLCDTAGCSVEKESWRVAAMDDFNEVQYANEVDDILKLIVNSTRMSNVGTSPYFYLALSHSLDWCL